MNKSPERIPAHCPWTVAVVLAVLSLPWAAPAQDLDCGSFVERVVVINNQATQMDADCTWALATTPVTGLATRATGYFYRADGTVEIGQTPLFRLTANSGNALPPIIPGVVDSIPTGIVLTAPTTTLDADESSVQLTVTATFPSGATADVTAGEEGTTYTLSSSATATISVDGLLEAVRSGTVLVAANHKGTVASRTFSVRLAGDSDADGMPDDYELANGFDPNNPADAMSDADRDDLSNLDEFLSGTEPRNPDTDGDNLEDGDEVDLHGTSPLSADTDGDGLNDGIEIILCPQGSDPNDADVANYHCALLDIQVVPTAVDMTNNTIQLSTTSRQLEVIGTLIDGSTLELHRPGRRTRYVLSEELVGTVSVDDFGIVVALLNDGAAVGSITVTNAAFMDPDDDDRAVEVAVDVAAFNPRAMALLPVPGQCDAVDVAAGHAFMACREAGLQVADVRDRCAPRLVASLDTPGENDLALDVKVVGERAYLGNGFGGITVFDVSLPVDPRPLGSLVLAGRIHDIAVHDGHLYAVDGGALYVVDVTTDEPRLLSSSSAHSAVGVDVEGDLAVVAQSFSLGVFDVRDPARPLRVGLVSGKARDVEIAGDLAYVSRSVNGPFGPMIVDLSRPNAPFQRGAVLERAFLTDLSLDRDVLVGSDVFFVNAAPIYDVSAAAAPVARPVLDFANRGNTPFSEECAERGFPVPAFSDQNGQGIAVDDGCAFVVGRRGGGSANALLVGCYRRLEDQGREAPRIAILDPAAATEAFGGSRLRVRARSTDDVAVDRVILEANSERVGEDRSAEGGGVYSITFGLPVVDETSGEEIVTLVARAQDLAGNQASSEPVAITVLHDPAPQVTILSPRPVTPATSVPTVEGTSLPVTVEVTDDMRVTSLTVQLGGGFPSHPHVPDGPGPHTIPVHVSVPRDPGTAELTATVSDGLSTATATLPVEIRDDLPPTVQFLAPAPGDEVVSGDVFAVMPLPEDDFQVNQVRLLVDGDLVAHLHQPFEFRYEQETPCDPGVGLPALMPGPHTISAVAIDHLGQESVPEDVTIQVIPDPETTVTGSVLDPQGRKVSRVPVRVRMSGGPTAESDAGGDYTLQGVPSTCRPLVISAEESKNNSYEAGSVGLTRATRGGITVADVEIRPAHLAYMPVSQPRGVLAVNTNTMAREGFIAMTGLPRAIEVSPDERSLYVLTFLSDPGASRSVVRIIDTATHSIVGTIPLPNHAADLALSPDGRRAYLSSGASRIEVLDLTLGEVVKTISGEGFFSPAHFELSPLGDRLFFSALVFGSSGTLPAVGSILLADDSLEAGRDLFQGPADRAFFQHSFPEVFIFGLPDILTLLPGGDRLYALSQLEFRFPHHLAGGVLQAVNAEPGGPDFLRVETSVPIGAVSSEIRDFAAHLGLQITPFGAGFGTAVAAAATAQGTRLYSAFISQSSQIAVIRPAGEPDPAGGVTPEDTVEAIIALPALHFATAALDSTPDGRLLIAVMSQREIFFIDTASHQIIANLALNDFVGLGEIRFRRRQAQEVFVP